MPARDLYHDAVRAALIKDGWLISADPYRIRCKDIDFYADLAAEYPIAAEREDQKIVVEIKSFVGRSLMADFHNAVGQYAVCRSLIQATEPEYKLYLAIDDITHENFFKREGIALVTRASQIALLVINIDQQEIVQ
jgi:XisH protein